MRPACPLPLSPEFLDAEEYVESLLNFATSPLLQLLCGGVHILDFYTRSPDLYSALLPLSWRQWFEQRDIMDILDLLMRENLGHFSQTSGRDGDAVWRDGPAPPADLIQYVRGVRKHLLRRTYPSQEKGSPQNSKIARHVTMGMKVKKVHEVEHFAGYIDTLATDLAAQGKEITHLVDFGSGQNYLGRALAAPAVLQTHRCCGKQTAQH